MRTGRPKVALILTDDERRRLDSLAHRSRSAPALARVRHVPPVGGKIALHRLLQVNGETRLRDQVAVPVPRPIMNTVTGALWLAQVSEAPPSFLDYLQYVCVADGDLAQRGAQERAGGVIDLPAVSLHTNLFRRLQRFAPRLFDKAQVLAYGFGALEAELVPACILDVGPDVAGDR